MRRANLYGRCTRFCFSVAAKIAAAGEITKCGGSDFHFAGERIRNRTIRYSFSYPPGTQRPLSAARTSHSFGFSLRSVVVLWHPTSVNAIINIASRCIAFPSTYVRMRASLARSSG
jgi:hypothetical protein